MFFYRWQLFMINYTTDFICKNINFSKFYGKVGVISWFLFHLIRKNYILYWDFDLKSWIVDFFTHFTGEKTPQNNFSSQNFSVENNYFYIVLQKIIIPWIASKLVTFTIITTIKILFFSWQAAHLFFNYKSL